MKKYTIDGKEYIRLSELRHEIRRLRRDIPVLYKNFDKDHQAMIHLAYNDVVKALYREELSKAETPEEIKAILDMPGEFMVVRSAGKAHEAFIEWHEGSPVVGSLDVAMIFSYEGMAKGIADKLNKLLQWDTEWRVMDVSEESCRDAKRLLEAIFREKD